MVPALGSPTPAASTSFARMDGVSGESLSRILRRGGHLDPEGAKRLRLLFAAIVSNLLLRLSRCAIWPLKGFGSFKVEHPLFTDHAEWSFCVDDIEVGQLTQEPL